MTPEHPAALRIATFNVNGVRGRLPRLLEWLAETTPDIACLQEIKTSDDRVPAAAIEAAGYRALWHGQRAHHGVAILAKTRGTRAAARLARRSRRPREPVSRGGRRRSGRGIGVPAQRQPAAGAAVRLQARVVRAADRACAGPDRRRGASGAGRRFQRRADESRHLQRRCVALRRGAAAADARRVSPAARTRMDRCDARTCTPTSASTRSG